MAIDTTYRKQLCDQADRQIAAHAGRKLTPQQERIVELSHGVLALESDLRAAEAELAKKLRPKSRRESAKTGDDGPAESETPTE